MEKKKEVVRRKGKEEEQIVTFAFDFPDCEEKSWDSGVIFYIIIAKGFHL